MTDYLVFEGQIQPMPWGDSLYTVLPLPDDVADTLAAQGAKRVEGEINDHPVNLALTKAPVIEATFVYTGKTLLDRCGIAPGDRVDVRLRKTDPAVVETPDDVMLALRAADVSAAWDALTPGKRRSLLHGVNTAKRAATRQTRIDALIVQVKA